MSLLLQEAGVLRGHSAKVTGLAFSRDGSRLASGSKDRTIKFWKIPDGQLINEWSSPEASSLSFSDDGTVLAAGCGANQLQLGVAPQQQDTLQARSVPDGDLLIRVEGGLGPEFSVVFSRRDYLAWLNYPMGKLTVYDFYNSQKLHHLCFNGSFSSVAFSPDGNHILTCEMHAPNQPLAGSEAHNIRLRSVNDGALALSFIEEPANYSHKLSFSGDGQFFAVANTESGLVSIRRTADGSLIRAIEAHDNYMLRPSFSHDGKYLATAGGHRRQKDRHCALIWDLADGSLLHTLTEQHDYLTAVEFSPAGPFLAAARDNDIILWQMAGSRQPEARRESFSGGPAGSIWRKRAMF